MVIAFFVFIFLDLPFDLAMIMMLMIIPAIGAAIIYLGMRIITARSLKRFIQEEKQSLPFLFISDKLSDKIIIVFNIPEEKE